MDLETADEFPNLKSEMNLGHFDSEIEEGEDTQYQYYSPIKIEESPQEKVE